MLSLELPRNGGAAPGTGLCRASCASAAQREVQLGLCGAVGGGAAPAGRRWRRTVRFRGVWEPPSVGREGVVTVGYSTVDFFVLFLIGMYFTPGISFSMSRPRPRHFLALK